jgi:hypothetical protein
MNVLEQITVSVLCVVALAVLVTTVIELVANWDIYTRPWSDPDGGSD